MSNSDSVSGVIEDDGLIDVIVQVPEGLYNLEQGIVKFVQACRQIFADGYKASDLPVIFVAAAANLLPIAADISKIGEEVKINIPASLICLGLLPADLAKVFLTPVEPLTPEDKKAMLSAFAPEKE